MEEIKQFDAWTCDFSMGGGNGVCEFGVRPCIIISNDINNRFSDRLNVIPLTTSAKKPMVTHCVISGATKATSVAICENITTIYKSQLGEKCGELNEFEKLNVIYCVKQQLGIK